MDVEKEYTDPTESIEDRLGKAIKDLEKSQVEKQKLKQDMKELEFSVNNKELYSEIKTIQTKTKHDFDTVKEILSAIGNKTFKASELNGSPRPIKKRRKWGSISNHARDILRQNQNKLFSPNEMSKITGASPATLSHTLHTLTKRIATVRRSKNNGHYAYWEGANIMPVDLTPTRRTLIQQSISVESRRKARELYERGEPLKRISAQTGIKEGSITHSIKMAGGTINRHPEKGRRSSSSSSTLKEENSLTALRKAIKSAVKIKSDIELPTEFKKAGVYPPHIDEMVLKHGDKFSYDDWFALCYRLDRAILLKPNHIMVGYEIVKHYLKNKE